MVLLTGLFLTTLAGCSQGPVPAAEFVAQAERLHAEALASTVNPDRDLNDYVTAIGQRIEFMNQDEFERPASASACSAIGWRTSSPKMRAS